ncbi:hypothetical protein F8154_02590 [Alkaliphilus pronyensis]|uniref:Uncharacterized protein n=1 Tax=Alkaliphilus pronyensis TaxID=1482732 RepID=A0A6I0FEM9_9FIRM|nr:hypothetical protein [Alkaliphilus pronyensis]KAB3537716.1 hypothetical protein F8154_02590 [Alkaliphilus pronyensis]
MVTAFQFMNLFIVILLMGVPVVVTVLLLRYFSKKASYGDENFMIQKIRELEKRIEELEKLLS